MIRRNQAHERRNQKLNQVWTDVTTEFPNLPTEFADAADAFTEFRRRLGLVAPAVQQQQQRKKAKGAVEEKNDLDAPLRAKLRRFANALHLRYKKEGDLKTALSLPLRKSEYTLMTQQEVVETGDYIAGLADTRKADLKGANITPAAIKQLAAELDAYRQSLPGYKVAVEQGSVGGKAVRQVFKENNTYLNEDLRAAIELLADDYPTAHDRLLAALRIDDIGTHTKKAEKKPKSGVKDATGPGSSDGMM